VQQVHADTHQYFMKASPVRPGDFIEFFAEIDLLGIVDMSGDCSASRSDDTASCYPLRSRFVVRETARSQDGSHAEPVFSKSRNSVNVGHSPTTSADEGSKSYRKIINNSSKRLLR
jgi:hypothetical protein